MNSRQINAIVVAVFFAFVGGVSTLAQPPKDANLPDVPGLDDDYKLRSGLENSRLKFGRDKSGVIGFVGGSITAAQGWSQMVADDLRQRFPETKFTFTFAGIPSVDSSGHAFRLQRDLLEKGVPDLVFVEAAVNDLHNGREETERLRAMEGIIRKLFKTNRFADLVVMHFAEPRHTADYERGQTPAVIASHEKIAERYQVPSLNLAHEVQRRMKHGQFDWARDFKDLHPSPFGHRLYFQAIRRLFERAWNEPVREAATPRERTLPEPLDRLCYDAGQLGSITAAERNGFRIDPKWQPNDKAGTRPGFVGMPMLVGERPGEAFSYRFDGRAIGFFLTVGPDTGVIEYRLDNGPWKQRDTLTQWSRSLHLPWVLLLEAELKSGSHLLEVRIPEPQDGRGSALRIRDVLVNGPAYDLPPLSEIRVKSTLDDTEQPSLVWMPDAAKSQPTPLLVYLHSWSGDYRQDNSPWQAEAVARGWTYLHPNFRGINKTPAACGSKLARQDIVDAVEHVVGQCQVDRSRIYLAGTSGGGHMTMLTASYFPERFSAVSAWVGISDLADWYQFHVKNGQPDHYAQMTVASLGGRPNESAAMDEEYRSRSPLFHLGRIGSLPLDIAAGVKDGKTGSVPILHSLRAFNAIASANGAETIPEAELTELWEKGALSQPRASDQEADATYGRRLYLRRSAGAARVTIFEGGHEGLPFAACEWLAKQRR